jgi:plastocyanin
MTALLIGVLALSAGVLAGTGQAAPSHAARPHALVNVSITEFMFSPNRLQVRVGDQVKWTNNGTVNHTSTAKGGVWNSGTIAPGGSFTFTFTAAGTFKYRCQFHPSLMTGGIKVVP